MTTKEMRLICLGVEDVIGAKGHEHWQRAAAGILVSVPLLLSCEDHGRLAGSSLGKSADTSASLVSIAMKSVDEHASEQEVDAYATSCDDGRADACRALARLYIDGEKTPQDFKRASALADKACALGDADGCALHAGSLLGVPGVERDYAKAVEGFKKACEAGSIDGCYGMVAMRTIE